MKKQIIEISKKQAMVLLESLDNYCEESERLEQEPDTSNQDRKELREERIEVEMLIKQIEALEW